MPPGSAPRLQHPGPGGHAAAAGHTLAGALVIGGHCIEALVELARSQDLGAARLLVIQGSLWGLSLKTAASLLKTMEIHSWEQIAAFTAVLALRTQVR